MSARATPRGSERERQRSRGSPASAKRPEPSRDSQARSARRSRSVERSGDPGRQNCSTALWIICRQDRVKPPRAPSISIPMIAAEMIGCRDPAGEEGQRPPSGRRAPSPEASGRRERGRRSPRAPPDQPRNSLAWASWLWISRMSARALSRSRHRKLRLTWQYKGYAIAKQFQADLPVPRLTTGEGDRKLGSRVLSDSSSDVSARGAFDAFRELTYSRHSSFSEIQPV